MAQRKDDTHEEKLLSGRAACPGRPLPEPAAACRHLPAEAHNDDICMKPADLHVIAIGAAIGGTDRERCATKRSVIPALPLVSRSSPGLAG